MRTTRIALLMFFAVVQVACCGTLADQVSGFTALKEGDELEVRWFFGYCVGGHKAYEFIFRTSTNAPGATVSALSLEGARSNHQATNNVGLIFGETNRVEFGSLTLKETELLLLEDMLQFYRRRLQRTVTGSETIVFTQRRAGRIIAQEAFPNAADWIQHWSENRENEVPRAKGIADLEWLTYRFEKMRSSYRLSPPQ